MMGVAKGTILRLLADVGTACAAALRNVCVSRVQPLPDSFLLVTPAMEAGINNRLWAIYDIIAMSEQRQVPP